MPILMNSSELSNYSDTPWIIDNGAYISVLSFK